MEFSTLILLIFIPAMMVAFIFLRKGAQFRGIGMFGAVCPQCATPLPAKRKATSWSEAWWGGWTCPGCGCKVGRYGKKRDWK